MRFGRRSSSCTAILLAGISATLPASVVPPVRHGSAAPKPVVKSVVKRTAAKPVAAKSKLKYQASIDDRRATEIQTALIKSGYLSGQPSGHWDSSTEAAMAKLQADNGWQTKLVPDSRALIKIGLGPSAAPKPDSDTVANQAGPSGPLSQR